MVALVSTLLEAAAVHIVYECVFYLYIVHVCVHCTCIICACMYMCMSTRVCLDAYVHLCIGVWMMRVRSELA